MSKPGNLLYLNNTQIRSARITKEGDFILETEATPSSIPERESIPVRCIAENTYRVRLTEATDEIVIPFATLIIHKKAVTNAARRHA